MSLTLHRLQELIHESFDAKDRQRGLAGSFMWFLEEVGELAAALRGGTRPEQAAEFADVLAWLATLANTAGVDLEAAVEHKYGHGCPRCHQVPCACAPADKP